MKIAVGSDHAGYEGDTPYKPAIIEHLQALGHEVVDCGTFGPDAVDYPDIATKVCETLQRGEATVGVLLCGTGIGMSITANRFKGIRAAVCATEDMVRLSRQHNNANVLCIGRRILSLGQCTAFIDLFLEAPFSDQERHHRRVDKMG